MDDKELDNYMKTVNPNFDSYIEKGTIEMSNEYYNLLEEKMARLINKNELLKKQLEELKSTNKVLSEKLTKDKILKQDCLTTCCGIPIGDIPKLINQQKKFISYLENEIYSIEPKGTGINYNCEYDSEEDYISAMKEQSKLNTLKEILSKYKKIIGGEN